MAAEGLAALELGLLLPIGLSADLAALRLDTEALIAAILAASTCKDVAYTSAQQQQTTRQIEAGLAHPQQHVQTHKNQDTAHQYLLKDMAPPD